MATRRRPKGGTRCPHVTSDAGSGRQHSALTAITLQPSHGGLVCELSASILRTGSSRHGLQGAEPAQERRSVARVGKAGETDVETSKGPSDFHAQVTLLQCTTAEIGVLRDYLSMMHLSVCAVFLLTTSSLSHVGGAFCTIVTIPAVQWANGQPGVSQSRLPRREAKEWTRRTCTLTAGRT